MAIRPPPILGNTGRWDSGVVLEVDDNHVALVRMSTGKLEQVRADLLPGKSAVPRADEKWFFDRRFGEGWLFAIPVGYLGGDAEFTPVPALSGTWSDVGGVSLPVGYLRDAEGWVSLQGQITGGVANTVAFILPPGYQPRGPVSFVVASGAGSAQLIVTALGAVTPVVSAVTTLEQVRFLARG